MTLQSDEMAAVCHRCGAAKASALEDCATCQFSPEGPERAVAWLFSAHHLSAEERIEAARRIRSGQRPDPSRQLRAVANAALRGLPAIEVQSDRLRPVQSMGLTIANVTLTPLIGLSLWFGLRPNHPVAARQALALTLPVALALFLLWIGLLHYGQ